MAEGNKQSRKKNLRVRKAFRRIKRDRWILSKGFRRFWKKAFKRYRTVVRTHC